MKPFEQTARLTMCAALLTLLTAAVSGCAYDVRFPTGQVRINSNGVSVDIDGHHGLGASVVVDLPLVNVDIRG